MLVIRLSTARNSDVLISVLPVSVHWNRPDLINKVDWALKIKHQLQAIFATKQD